MKTSNKKDVAAIIDDESFKKYEVQNVPSFVFRKDMTIPLIRHDR
jgi:hypothetical protein